MFEYNCIIERVVDGDTVDVRVDAGFDIWTKQRVRLMGIDTPESRTRDLREKKFGKLATARVEELLPVGSKQRIVLTKGKGKYGRYLADFIMVKDIDGNMWTYDLCTMLVCEHLAVRYEGQAKAEVRAAHEANWDHLEYLNDARAAPGDQPGP